MSISPDDKWWWEEDRASCSAQEVVLMLTPSHQPSHLSVCLTGRDHNNKQPERADQGLSTVLTGLVTCDIQYPSDILTWDNFWQPWNSCLQHDLDLRLTFQEEKLNTENYVQFLKNYYIWLRCFNLKPIKISLCFTTPPSLIRISHPNMDGRSSLVMLPVAPHHCVWCGDRGHWAGGDRVEDEVIIEYWSNIST